MNKKIKKLKGFLSTYKKTIITGLFSVLALSSVLAVALSTSETNITENKPNIEINKEEIQNPDPNLPVINPNTISFILPLENCELIKDFSNTSLRYNTTLKQWESHKAVDLKAEEGAPVFSVLSGKVESIKNDYLKGTIVTISHDDGFKTVYASLKQEVLVDVGNVLSQGDAIGYVSTSAKGEIADGSHLHFEMYKDGKIVDPNLYITFEGKWGCFNGLKKL